MNARHCAICLTSILFAASALAQGNLTPPPGAPSPTMKTLDQVEPRTDLQRVVNPLPTDATNHIIISSPGSYYLSANLAVTKTNGIHVTVAGVTIDLNGFKISRTAGSGGAGILIDETADGCTVRDGSLVGFDNGIQSTFGTRLPRGGAFLHLSASACTAAGTGLVAGENWEVVGCRAHGNAGAGISAAPGSVLRDCSAENNAGAGIDAGFGSTLTNCSAVADGDFGGI